MQGLIGGSNKIEKKWSIDSLLYLVRNDNRSGHMVYKFDTQPMVSVNQLKTVPTPSSVIDRINSIGETRDQSNRIKFSIIDDREAL